MTDYVGALDETNNGEYIACMICDNDALIKNTSFLPPNFTHMTKIFYDSKLQQNIINSFDFDGNILIGCIKFGIPEVREFLRNAINNRRVPQSKYRSKVSYRMTESLNGIFDNFLSIRKLKITDIQFQVDNEIIKRFLIEGGLKCIKPSHAHKIVDCIAYANFKKWQLKSENIIEKGDEFKYKFHNMIKKDLNF